MSAVQTETRLARRIEERERAHSRIEDLYREANGGDLNDSQREEAVGLTERTAVLDTEIAELTSVVEAHNRSVEASRKIRNALAGGTPGVEVEGDGVVYRDFNSYAFDYFITRTNILEVTKITRQWGVRDDEIQAAAQRLDLIKRTPANTLSSNVAGLTPPQHIAEIFQNIDTSRPIVQSARRASLERGTLTYPRVDTPPVVAVQSAEKTEAGNTGLAVSMQTATATTYLGGGDLSWQAINWSTPNALRLWFDLVTADYALKTEQDAAQVMQHSAFSNNIASTLAATPTFAQFMTAVGAGYAEVFANSGRTADTIYMAPDRFGYLLGLTSDAFSQFVSVDQAGIGPLRVVISRGMDSGVIVVGDRQALLVAETPDAPVEMQVVEPAIGGVEVGLIGAFEAVVVDDGAFAMLTTAS